MHIATAALHRRQALQDFTQTRAQLIDFDISFCQQVTRTAAFLIEQRNQHMHRLNDLMVLAQCQTLGFAQCQLKFVG